LYYSVAFVTAPHVAAFVVQKTKLNENKKKPNRKWKKNKLKKTKKMQIKIKMKIESFLL